MRQIFERKLVKVKRKLDNVDQVMDVVKSNKSHFVKTEVEGFD